MHARDDLAVEGRGQTRAGVRETTHHLRDVTGLEGGVGRVDPLGREREKEVLADAGPALSEHGQEQFLRGPRVGGALEHHQLPRVDPSGGRLGGGHHGRDVRVLRLPERCGYADDHHVAALQHACVDGGFVPAVRQQLRQFLVPDVGGARLPEVEGDHPVQVGVEAVHAETCPGELDRQRQADVPLADDGEPRGATLEAPVERGCVIHAGFSLNAQTVRARQFRPRRQRRARRAS